MMLLTGERVISGRAAPDLFNEHVARCDFVGPLTDRRCVLDVGCGVGYDSDRLVRRALSVTAFNIALRTGHTKSTGRRNGCSYQSFTVVFFLFFGVALLLCFLGCGGRKRVKLPPPTPAVVGWSERGVASWYGHPYHGRITSNGERYDMNKISAAHKSLPFNTWVRVINLSNNKRIDVRINDRGPFVRGRIIDLSRAAAKEIDMIGPGTTKVVIKVIAKPGQRYRPKHNMKRDETLPKKIIAQSPSVLPAAPAYVEPAERGHNVDGENGDAALSDPCSPGIYFGVQVGAFKLVDNAELLLDKMANSKFDAGDLQIVKSQLAQGVRHRVIVGRFLDVNMAQILKKRLRNNDIDGFVAKFKPPPPPDCQVQLDGQ